MSVSQKDYFNPPAISNSDLDSLSKFELEGLMSGEICPEELSEIGISQVTTDVRLNNIFERSNAQNLAEFLQLGEFRFKLRGYGKRSERKLKESLLEFLKERLDSATGRIDINGKDAYSHSSLISQSKFDFNKLLEAAKPEELINSSIWQMWMLKMIDMDYMGEPIFHVCQEAGCNWPVKHGWKEKTFEDFCSDSPKDLLSGKNFGKIKLRSLIKSVAYLLSGGREHLNNKTPKEKLIWLKNTINLNAREQEIFERRSKGETLDEIGVLLNVTRERIRQIQKEILFKYRSPIGLQICSEYLDERQQAIWLRATKGKFYLPQSTSLSIERLQLDDYDCFAVFVYTGERIKGERFNEMIAEFFNSRFKQASGCWYDLKFDESDVKASIAIVQSTLSQIATPVTTKELANRIPNISQELLLIAVQLAERVNSYCGYIVYGRLTQRKRRAIGVHIILSELEQSDSIVSTSDLSKAYRAAFSFDQCTDRDIEIVMVDRPHLFFRIGQEGWVSCGISGQLNTGFYVSNSSVEEEDEKNEWEVSEKVWQMVEALDEIGISHVTELNAHLLKKGICIPMTSLQPMLYMHEPFSRFAPGFYGLKKHLDDIDAVVRARAKLTNGILRARISVSQLRSYVFARYAGESREVYALWGKEFEALWAEMLLEKENDELVESFWSIVIPGDIAPHTVTLKRYEDRKNTCVYRLNSDIPPIENEQRVDFDELLASLIYLKHVGKISCARSNILLGRRIDGHHSVALLATLVLVGAVKPEDDWRKAHYLDGETDSIIKTLKRAYSQNQQITWSTGMEKLLARPHSKRYGVKPCWCGQNKKTLQVCCVPIT